MRPALLIGLVACSRPAHAPLYPAGSEQDDGYGDLAQKSASLVSRDDDEPPWPPRHHHRLDDAAAAEPYPVDEPDEPDPHGLTDLDEPSPPHYEVRDAGLSGSIEGTITWRGPRPAPRITACGATSPALRVAGNGAAGGVLVYIEHVTAGREIAHDHSVARVGGLLVKHGCDLAPALQLVTPLPAAVVIHGDPTATTLRIAPPDAAPSERALQPAGRITLSATPGITRIDAQGATAWIVATEAPYYAITDDAGRYRIDELAPGAYDLSIIAPPTTGAPRVVHRAIQVGARPTHLDIALGP